MTSTRNLSFTFFSLAILIHFCYYRFALASMHVDSKRFYYYIWCKSIDYIVILEDRNSHYKLITAYNVMPNKVREYEKEYVKYKKTKTPT